MMRRWGPSLILLALALVMTFLYTGLELLAVVPMLLLAFVVSPSAFPRSVSDAAARESSAQDGRPIVYWRPGCPFCMRLRAGLGRDARRLHWVDIWSDPAGAATVRGVTGGDETVPTVVAASGAFVNPAPAKVRELARSAA